MSDDPETPELLRPVHAERVRGTFCQHWRKEYCLEQRFIECQSYKARLDPFDAFVSIHEHFNRLTFTAKYDRNEAK